MTVQDLLTEEDDDRRILIVDDEEGVRKIFAAHLALRYTCKTAGNAQEALAR